MPQLKLKSLWVLASFLSLSCQWVRGSCGGLQGKALQECDKAEMQMIEEHKTQMEKAPVTWVHPSGASGTIPVGSLRQWQQLDHFCETAKLDGTFSIRVGENIADALFTEITCKTQKVFGRAHLFIGEKRVSTAEFTKQGRVVVQSFHNGHELIGSSEQTREGELISAISYEGAIECHRKWEKGIELPARWMTKGKPLQGTHRVHKNNSGYSLYRFKDGRIDGVGEEYWKGKVVRRLHFKAGTLISTETVK